MHKDAKIYGQLPDWILKTNKPQDISTCKRNYGNMIFWYAVANFFDDLNITIDQPINLFQIESNHHFDKYFDIDFQRIKKQSIKMQEYLTSLFVD